MVDKEEKEVDVHSEMDTETDAGTHMETTDKVKGIK